MTTLDLLRASPPPTTTSAAQRPAQPSPPLNAGSDETTLDLRTNEIDVANSEPVDRSVLEAAVEKLQTAVKVHHPNLHFEIDEDSGRSVVHLIDEESGETIRQIPSEQALRAARALRDGTGGALISELA